MPQVPFIINEFNGGINNVSDARDLAKNELVEANDVNIANLGKIDTLGARGAYGAIESNFTGAGATKAARVTAGTGFFAFRTSRNFAKAETGEDWLALGDLTNGNIDLYDYGTNTWHDGYLSFASVNSEADFVFIDDVLRFYDRVMAGSNMPKWWGYIKRRKFDSATGAYTDDQWYEVNNHLAAPSTPYCVIEHANMANNANGSDNIIVELSYDDQAIEHEWKQVWEFAMSNVYDGNQESLLTVGNTTIDLTDDTTYQTLSKMRVTLGINGTGTELEGLLNKRLSHKKIYMRKYGTETWFLQGVYDLGYGGSTPNGEIDDDWDYDTDVGGYMQCSNSKAYSDVPFKAFDYKLETGHEPDVLSVDITGADTGYRTAAVVNRKMYVGGTRRLTQNNQTTTESGKIYPSDKNKFDRFRSDLGFAVAPGDTLRLIGFGEKLLEFKKDSLNIINCGGDEEYPEATYQHRGIEREEGVCETEFGPVWVNKYGMFLYDGEAVINLLEKTSADKPLHRVLTQATWTAFYTVSAMPAYLPEERQILVVRAAESTTSKDVYIYDMVNQAFVSSNRGLDLASTGYVSRMVVDRNGKLIWVDGNTTATFRYWDSTPTASAEWKITTKDFDLGSLGTYDYVYKIIITYKNATASALTNVLKMSIDGNNSFLNTGIGSHSEAATLTGVFAASKTVWQRAVFTLSKPVLLETIQLQITTGTAVALSVNDMTIWHRPLPNRKTDT